MWPCLNGSLGLQVARWGPTVVCCIYMVEAVAPGRRAPAVDLAAPDTFSRVQIADRRNAASHWPAGSAVDRLAVRAHPCTAAGERGTTVEFFGEER